MTARPDNFFTRLTVLSSVYQGRIVAQGRTANQSVGDDRAALSADRSIVSLLARATSHLLPIRLIPVAAIGRHPDRSRRT